MSLTGCNSEPTPKDKVLALFDGYIAEIEALTESGDKCLASLKQEKEDEVACKAISDLQVKFAEMGVETETLIQTFSPEEREEFKTDSLFKAKLQVKVAEFKAAYGKFQPIFMAILQSNAAKAHKKAMDGYHKNVAEIQKKMMDDYDKNVAENKKKYGIK